MPLADCSHVSACHGPVGSSHETVMRSAGSSCSSNGISVSRAAAISAASSTGMKSSIASTRPLGERTAAAAAARARRSTVAESE